jgi:hypothetical protein
MGESTHIPGVLSLSHDYCSLAYVGTGARFVEAHHIPANGLGKQLWRISAWKLALARSALPLCCSIQLLFSLCLPLLSFFLSLSLLSLIGKSRYPTYIIVCNPSRLLPIYTVVPHLVFRPPTSLVLRQKDARDTFRISLYQSQHNGALTRHHVVVDRFLAGSWPRVRLCFWFFIQLFLRTNLLYQATSQVSQRPIGETRAN